MFQFCINLKFSNAEKTNGVWIQANHRSSRVLSKNFVDRTQCNFLSFMSFELLWENYALRSFESSCSLHEQFSDEARAHTKLEFLQREFKFRSLDCEKCF